MLFITAKNYWKTAQKYLLLKRIFLSFSVRAEVWLNQTEQIIPIFLKISFSLNNYFSSEVLTFLTPGTPELAI